MYSLLKLQLEVVVREVYGKTLSVGVQRLCL
jgi:hypothetical protein